MRQRERGFTLIELTIAVTILGIMVVTLATVFTVMARTADQTEQRFTQSRGAKFAGIYWNPDVASSELVNPAGVRCGTAGTPLVTFRWVDDWLPQTQVSTWASTTGGSSWSLVRYLCDANALSAPTRTTTVAPSINPAGTNVSCDAGSGLAACGTNAKPSRVLLSITTADGRTLIVDGTREVG
jgi:prepilin-type N-terminal cleavage/methylation domain-containing protein